MTSVADFERQAMWELGGVREAAENYLSAAKAADPATLPAGRRLTRETVGPLVAALDANKKVVAASDGKTLKSAALRWLAGGDSTIQAAAAVTTITSVLLTSCWESSSFYEGRPTATLAKLANAVASTLAACREHEEWIIDTKEAHKEDGGKGVPPLLKKFRLRYPTPTLEDWKRWREQHNVPEVELETALATQIGGAVVQWLAEGAPKWVELMCVRSEGRTTNVITLTENATNKLADVATRAEVATPFFRPMIIPPNDWLYDEQGNLSGGYRHRHWCGDQLCRIRRLREQH